MKWEKKTNKKSDHSDLTQLIYDINHTPNEEFEAFVKNTFEYDKLVNMLALNMFLSNNSTYYHNYYLYHDLYNTSKWQMFPWDMDKTLSYYNWMPYTYHQTSSEWESDNPLVERAFLCQPIFNDIQKRVDELHENVLNNKKFTPTVDSLMVDLESIILKDTTDKIKSLNEKKKELQEFISRFSANASKSKQATSRRKLLDKINVEEIKPSSRRYPAIIFDQVREAGDKILEVEYLSKEGLFKDFHINVNKGNKIAFVGKNSNAITALFKVLAGEIEADKGEIKWGQTITHSYLPNENDAYFNGNDNLVDWLRQYSEEKDEVFIRGFLGKMLFTGEEVFKKSDVLSGGEKVRCMLSRTMLLSGNVLIMDEPTNHLDLESIQALNNALINFKGTVLFTSHDHQFVQTVANRIVELGPTSHLDKLTTYDEFIESDKIKAQREELYS